MSTMYTLKIELRTATIIPMMKARWMNPALRYVRIGLRMVSVFDHFNCVIVGFRED